MAEFSVRIDFYRSPDKPPQDAGYVGSALRDEFHWWSALNGPEMVR
jgi:hypothetical protein